MGKLGTFSSYNVMDGIGESKQSRNCTADNRKAIRSGVIVFQRENRGRIKAERAEYLFEFCGILVACVEDKSGLPDFERKDFNGLDFVLVPNKKLNRCFPDKKEMKGKVICYYEEDPFLELMDCIGQEEAKEILEIYQIIVDKNLFPMIYILRYENSGLFFEMWNHNRRKGMVPAWKEVIRNICDYKFLEILINEFSAEDDFVNAYHMTFVKWYLKAMHNKIMKKFKCVSEYLGDFWKIYQKFAGKISSLPKAFIHLIAGELYWSTMYFGFAKPLWVKLGGMEYNRYIAAKFYRCLASYESPVLSNQAGHVAEKLHPMCGEYVFLACSIAISFCLESKSRSTQLIEFQKKQMENYLKFFQKDLLQLENFTFQELCYNIKLYSVIRQNYSIEKKQREIPYFSNFFEIVKEYFYTTIDQLPIIEQAMLESAIYWRGNMAILGIEWRNHK